MAGVEQLDPTRSLRDIGRAMRELELAIPSAGPERVTEAAVNLFRVLNERGLINADALMRGGQSNPSTLENGLASMKEALVDGIPSQASTCLSNNLGSFLPPEIRRQVRNLPEMEFNETNFKLFENPGGIGEILGGPAWPNSMSQLAIAAVNESLRNGQPLPGLRLPFGWLRLQPSRRPITRRVCRRWMHPDRCARLCPRPLCAPRSGGLSGEYGDTGSRGAAPALNCTTTAA